MDKRIFFAVVGLLLIVGTASAWSESMNAWDCRKEITINNTGANLTNYQLMFTVNRSAGTDSGFTVFLDGECESDYDDIRFTTGDEETLCDYWIESSSSTVANIWVEAPSIVNSTAYGSTTLYLYYGNSGASAVSDGDATFLFFDDFGESVWQKHTSPILNATSAWEQNYVQEPTAIYEGNAQILSGDVYKMWYRGGWGSGGQLGYAESYDMYNWTKYPSNPLMDDMVCPYVFKVDSTYYLYVRNLSSANFEIYTSSDGIAWSIIKDVALALGSAGSWEDVCFGNYFVWIEGESWYLIYEAFDGSMWRLGLATSDDGLNWTKYGSNPIITYGTGTIGGPFVKKIGSTYWLWSHGVSSGTLPSDMMRYYSTDLHTWTLDPSGHNLIRTETWEGAGSAVGQIADPHLIEVNDNVYLFYEGSTNGFDGSGFSNISIAVANMNFTELVSTDENYAVLNTDKWAGSTGNAATTSSKLDFLPGTGWAQLYSKGSYVWDRNIALHAKIQFKNRGATYGSNIGFRTASLGANYIHLMYYGDATTSHFRSNVPSFNEDTNTDTNNNIYEITWLSGGYTATKNGISMTGSPQIGTTLDVSIPISFEGIGSGYGLYCDYIFIRQYTATEPTVSAWGSEEMHPALSSDFTSNVTIGYPNFTVAFTDTSIGTPTDWDWYVDDVKVSDDQNPIYAFDDVIENSITYYTIKLNATNETSGYSWQNKTDYITAYPLNASFTANVTNINEGDAVLFTDLTDNGTATSWNWSFGDGNYSSLQNPEYTYTTDGTYNVTLNASNLYSWDIETKLSYITVNPLIYGLHTLGIYGNTSTLNISFYGSSDITSDYWFEFSGTSDGFTMATDRENITAGDPVEIRSPRVPFIDNTTYYYRIAREDENGTVSYGETLTFTAASVAPIPTTTYTEEYYKPFYRAKWNLSVLAGIVPVPYFAKFGYLLWAIFWGAILMAFWVRQEDVTIPSFMYLIIFFTLDLADLLPSSFVAVSWVFAGICFGAILYTLFRGRKHG